MLEINNLSVDFTTFELNDISFTLPDESTLVILGRSGSGKTLLLETIAGRYQANGSIVLNGNHLEKRPAENRNIALVYQNFGLFPFLNVYDNIVFPLKMRDESKSEYDVKAKDLMKRLSIEHIEKFGIKNLSGGEKQRVSLARALIMNPDLLMLDEPLSALDADNKTAAAKLINELVKNLGIPMIYVTHDMDEALYFADYIAYMDEGEIVKLEENQTKRDALITKM